MNYRQLNFISAANDIISMKDITKPYKYDPGNKVSGLFQIGYDEDNKPYFVIYDNNTDTIRVTELLPVPTVIYELTRRDAVYSVTINKLNVPLSSMISLHQKFKQDLKQHTMED